MEKNIQKTGYSLMLTIDGFNKRVRVDDYVGNVSSCVNEAMQIAIEEGAEKLIFKVRREQLAYMLAQGFVYEAMIDSFYLGSACFFVAKYFTNERRNSEHWVQEDQMLQSVFTLSKQVKVLSPPTQYVLRKAELSDAVLLADLYRTVFEIYPTPMNDPIYIKKCMKEATVFFIYLYEGKIVSAAAAEMNRLYHNAEMTDCATLPEHRQFGLLKQLMLKIEEELVSQDIYCVYSIARALSFGMNAALHQLGYAYRGRLANNCFIFNKVEDMNMWVKQLV